MRIIGEIGEAIRTVQAAYDIDLQETVFRPEHREEVLHVVIHETCHTAISHSAPWVNTLPDNEHTAVDEIAARVLETEISEQLSLYVHSVEGHVRELGNYGLDIPVDTLGDIFSVWTSLPHTKAGIESLCKHIRETLFEEGI
jgi:hypothetical protein